MLMQIDGTFLFAAISFLIFLFIIKNILFNPINRVISERDNFYAKNSKMELESKEKSKILLEKKECALNESRKEAAQIIKNTSDEAKALMAQKIKQTKQDLNLSIEANLKTLEQEKATAKAELKGEVNSIVSKIISKVLNENVEINLPEEKIKKYLEI